VEKIYEFKSKYFIKEMERCEKSKIIVGKCLISNEKKFYLYDI
jgi:hypothetical protein